LPAFAEAKLGFAQAGPAYAGRSIVTRLSSYRFGGRRPGDPRLQKRKCPAEGRA
jgi:hypothetical protein